MIGLVRRDRSLRILFLAQAQSQLGSGAAYVALALIAFARFHSAWAISLILLAEAVTSAGVSGLGGVLADRYPRTPTAVAAESVRCLSFLGIVLLPGFPAMLLCAIAAGCGRAIFKPAAAAGLVALTSEPDRPAAMALWGLLADLGLTLGPLLAGALMLLGPPNTVLTVNAATFAVSAVMLAQIDLGRASAVRAAAPQGVRPGALWRLPVLKLTLVVMLVASLVAATINVAEPLLATQVLHSGRSGFAALLGAYGIGMMLAAPLVARLPNRVPDLARALGRSLLVTAVGCVASALSPSVAVGLITFAVTGVGTSLAFGSANLLVQAGVPEGQLGSAFGLLESATSVGLICAFLLGGVETSSFGPRAVFSVAAGVLWIVGTFTYFGGRAVAESRAHGAPAVEGARP